MVRLVTALRDADPSRVVWLAPAIFCLHFFEEAPGFVQWFNSLVQRGISQRLFIAVNLTAFLITAIVAGTAAALRNRPATLTALGWLSFLMFANAVFHLTGTAVHRKYSPGAVTAALFYLPYFGWFAWLVYRRFALDMRELLLTVFGAGLAMFAHGYLIVFKGSRLF